jgi:2-keto-4-pentenoate hydratase
MMDKISEIANRQLTDFRNTTPGMCFSEKAFTLKISEAYAVQDAMVNLRVNDGDSVIGYKIGCTGPGTTKLFGIQGPIRGTLFKAEMHSDGARIKENQFCNLAVEAEMAIEMGQNGQIASVFPAIELHNYIFRGPTKSLAELVANNGLNKGIVLSKYEWWNFSAQFEKKSTLSLEINEIEVDFGDLWPMAGGPSSSLDWLHSHLAEYNKKLSQGDIILGGTALGLHRVQSGQSISVKVDGEIAVQCFVK